MKYAVYITSVILFNTSVTAGPQDKFDDHLPDGDM